MFVCKSSVSSGIDASYSPGILEERMEGLSQRPYGRMVENVIPFISSFGLVISTENEDVKILLKMNMRELRSVGGISRAGGYVAATLKVPVNSQPPIGKVGLKWALFSSLAHFF